MKTLTLSKQKHENMEKELSMELTEVKSQKEDLQRILSEEQA